MKILLDSDALYSLYIPTDPHFEKAKSTITRLKKNQVSFYITNLVIQETATVISHKVDQKLAKGFVNNIDSLDYQLVTIDPAIELESWKIFLNQNKKGTSFVDCSNIALYKILKADGIFSFDKFYKRMGLTIFN